MVCFCFFRRFLSGDYGKLPRYGSFHGIYAFQSFPQHKPSSVVAVNRKRSDAIMLLGLGGLGRAAIWPVHLETLGDGGDDDRGTVQFQCSVPLMYLFVNVTSVLELPLI